MLWVTPILEIKCSPAFLLCGCSMAAKTCPLPPKPLLFASREIRHIGPQEELKSDTDIVVGVCHGPSCLLAPPLPPACLTEVVCVHLAA